ncbi:hypothetical protein Dda_5669 [Drechslerella dactyloides]|uniref:F-box domain-containing protein n=1 Tax=Drechslerella dactyloides TaxID=74499 RepID=A0AAD6IWL7_DREDA|nr:hypothetical protein Dda_5669 [Drechslerella dactyloides]
MSFPIPQAKQPGRGSLASLPTELHIQVLSYLPWKSHIPCMAVCKLWKQILESEGLQYQRFNEATNPPHHNVAPELSFILTDQGISSTTIRPDNSKIYARMAVASMDPTGLLRSLAAATSNNDELRRFGQPSMEESAMTAVELRGSGVLDDPLFYHDTPGTAHVHPQKKRRIKGLAFCGTTWTDAVSHIPTVAGGKEWLFEEHPQLEFQTLREFVRFAASLVKQGDFWKQHNRATFDVKFLNIPEAGFLWFGLDAYPVASGS